MKRKKAPCGASMAFAIHLRKPGLLVVSAKQGQEVNGKLRRTPRRHDAAAETGRKPARGREPAAPLRTLEVVLGGLRPS